MCCKCSSFNGIEKYPKLRFQGFTIPWTEIEIGKAFQVTRGYVLPATVVRQDASEEYIYPVYSSQTKDNGLMGYYNDYLYENAITWTTDGANAGTVHYRPGKFYCTNVCGVLLSDEGNANRCVAEILGSISKKYVSYVGNPKLMNNVMSEIKIYVPTIAEQKKIDEFISVIDHRIEKQRELIEHLKKYKRGAITLILSNKDASWKSGRLGDFITINRGGSPRPIEAFITNDPDGVNWIKIGDVSEDSLYITQTAEKITAEGSRKSRKVFAGDLILSNSMSFGRPYIMQIEGCIHDGWLLLRDDGACFDKKYLCYYLASDEVLAQYKKYAAGSCVSNLNSELVSNVFIEFPPLEKQKEIASSLELLDERINCEIKLLDKLLLIKKGLLQSLFI